MADQATTIDVAGVQKVAKTAIDATTAFSDAHAKLLRALDANANCFGDDKHGKELKKNYESNAGKATDLAKGVVGDCTNSTEMLYDSPDQFQDLDADSGSSGS